MDKNISTGGGRGRNKRFWTLEEDNARVAALFDLATDPHWKCDNGFRSGYMIRLEEVIEKALPGCGLKASPHIDSRIKTLVTKFRAIAQMLNTSGFKWDDQKNTIYVERTVYDEYCKGHPNCKNLYGKAFPHLHSLMEIYGKDYATGKSVEGFVDAVGNMEKTDSPSQIMLDSSDEEDVTPTVNAFRVEESAPPLKKMKRENTPKNKGGKKKVNASSSELASLQGFMKDMNVHLSTVANVMTRTDEREQHAHEREQLATEKSEKVLDELLALGGITQQQALKVAQILIVDSSKLLIFSKCPGALKVMFVKDLLGENVNENA
ncbi:hypothetical protein M5689_003084 [Euphorbia peplus]|nr:hypothetical protein M5689_003084 [Euphorbia peplus]